MAVKRIKFVTKVVLLTGCIAAIASLIVGLLMYKGTTDIVFNNAIERLKYETNINSLHLLSNFETVSSDVRSLMGTPPIQGIPRAMAAGGIDPFDNSTLQIWKDRLAIIFTEMIRAKVNYSQIRLIGVEDNGKELVSVERHGSMISIAQAGSLQQKGHTNYFKGTMHTAPGDVYLSPFNLNREYGRVEWEKPVLRVAAPVYFQDKLFGMVVVNMDVNKVFDDFIKNTPFQLTPYVTNEQGYFIAHPDRSKTFGFDRGFDYRINDIYPQIDLSQQIDLRETEFTVTTDTHVIHVVKARFDPLNNNRFLGVMLATSRDNLLTESVQLRNRSFFIIALLVLVSLVVAAIMASRLLKPLRQIAQAAEDLAQGKEISDLPLQGGDEIADLARSFDMMRQQLEAKEKQLLNNQAKVYHSNKMVSLGEMAGGMAHEINSPLQVITLISKRVKRLTAKTDWVGINDAMGSINDAVSKITNIIESLRKMSRNSSNDDLALTRVGLIIDDVISLTTERYKLKNINFTVHYYDVDENLQIFCQRIQIAQVIINLLNNAYDAVLDLSQKWIKLEIAEHDGQLEISVTDSGKGIAPAIQEKIFEPLFTSKDIGQGTGLGLSISAEIAAHHQAVLELDTDAVNTRFVLRFARQQDIQPLHSENVIAFKR